MQQFELLLHSQIVKAQTPGLQYLHVSPESVLFSYVDGLARVAGNVPVTRATTFNGFSVTKTFTAVAILQLVERKLVDLDQSAQKYLPPFPYPESVTVRQLLAHSSGIANPIPLRWIHLDDEHATFDRNAFFARVYRQHPRLTHGPDAKFAYSNLGYQLLGELIESVTAMPYEQYITENILDRIGVSHVDLGFAMNPALHARGYHKRMSLSYPILGFLMDRARSFEGREGAWEMFRPYHMNGAAYGGLIGSAAGFARFLQALLDDRQALLTSASMAQLFTEHRLVNGKPSGMALAWFTGRLDGERYLHHAGGGGGYYAELRLYPRLKRASVLLFNRTGMSNVNFLDRVDRLSLGAIA